MEAEVKGMKIVALNGSHRGAKGNTQRLLELLAQGARAAGAQFETVVLAERKVLPCTGCEVCHTPEHRCRCVQEEADEVRDIFATMQSADILVYATPVYVFSMTGLMKTFLDRINSTAGGEELCLTQSGLLFHRIDNAIYTKPFVVVTCCGNVEEETVRNVLSYFRTFSRFLDAPLVGTLVRKSVGLLESPQAELSPSQVRSIETVAAAYVAAGRELASQGRISAGTQKKANQPILGVPCLDWLLRFRFFKKQALKRHNASKTEDG